ncbi:hypothetical protein ONZ45_g4099 [Pleurotus djamor]|nr:hypothetical protein ONZ45_g4099 [Pleurotus djamor]
MSRLDNGRITEKRFAVLRPLGPHIPEKQQAPASDTASSISGTTRSRRIDACGCILTRALDLTNERIHWVAAVRDEAREADKLAIIHLLAHELRVVFDPDSFNLESPENMSLLRIVFLRHHDLYATIAISPSIATLFAFSNWLTQDNQRRQSAVAQGHPDPGRSSLQSAVDAGKLKPAEFLYEIVILHPSHFLVNDESIGIYDGSTWVPYHPSNNLLVDATGAELPPFRDTLGGLNPILVNFAAALRYRRFLRVAGNQLVSPRAQSLAFQSIQLHDLVMWKPSPPSRIRMPLPTAQTVGELSQSGDYISTTATSHPAAPAAPTLGASEAPTTYISHGMSVDEMERLLYGGKEFLPLPDLIDAPSRDTSSSPTPSFSSKVESWKAALPQSGLDTDWGEVN